MIRKHQYSECCDGAEHFPTALKRGLSLLPSSTDPSLPAAVLTEELPLVFHAAYCCFNLSGEPYVQVLCISVSYYLIPTCTQMFTFCGEIKFE